MKFFKTLRNFLLYYGLKYNKNFLSVIKIFTEKYIFLFVIVVVYLILRHYAKGNKFLSRNGFRAPITRI